MFSQATKKKRYRYSKTLSSSKHGKFWGVTGAIILGVRKVGRRQ